MGEAEKKERMKLHFQSKSQLDLDMIVPESNIIFSLAYVFDLTNKNKSKLKIIN